MTDRNDLPTLKPGHYCYYIPDQDVDEHGGYVPALVIENELGYRMMLGNGPCAAPWVWGKDREVAEQIAAERNDRMGLSPERVLEIVASSMFPARRSFRP